MQTAFPQTMPPTTPATSLPPAAASPLQQEHLKALVAQAALQYVVPGGIVGVGTGSTVNHFIDALVTLRERIAGAVSSSVASTARLQALGIPVMELGEIGRAHV